MFIQAIPTAPQGLCADELSGLLLEKSSQEMAWAGATATWHLWHAAAQRELAGSGAWTCAEGSSGGVGPEHFLPSQGHLQLQRTDGALHLTLRPSRDRGDPAGAGLQALVCTVSSMPGAEPQAP